MKLTIDTISAAMKGNEFWLDHMGVKAQIVQEATRRGYLRRFSTTQVEWTEEGLERARKELAEPIAISEVEKLAREICNDLSKGDLKSLGAFVAFRDELLARLKDLG